jgi:integrase
MTRFARCSTRHDAARCRGWCGPARRSRTPPAEYLRYIEHDRGRKPSKLRGYRSTIDVHLLPVFGELPIESVSAETIEQWVAGFEGSPRTRNKVLIQLHGILGRARWVYGLPANAAADVEKFPLRSSGDIEVFSPEEVWALVRAASSDQDGAAFLTAAFTGLRMGELLALRWRDVDFAGRTIRVRASHYLGQLTTPKSGRVRAVPMAPDVAAALARLAQREHSIGDDDLVFAGEAGGYLDGSALRRRYKAALAAAGLRLLRFHEYADVRVMPMSLRRGCSARGSVLRGRHNQSASRNASRLSRGR